MNRQCKGVPKFSNAAEERVFWETHDSTEYLDWNKTQKAVLPDLKPTTKTISCVCLSICWTRSRLRLMPVMFPISHLSRYGCRKSFAATDPASYFRFIGLLTGRIGRRSFVAGADGVQPELRFG